MSVILPEQFEQLLPLALQYAKEWEECILQKGVTLPEKFLADAKQIPVMHPDKVRLLKVDAIPIPRHPALKVMADLTGLISDRTAGLTLCYGIFIRSDGWSDRKLIVHELAHVAQYERLGSTEAFLRQYLNECITIGYPEAPLEQEAIAMAHKICN